MCDLPNLSIKVDFKRPVTQGRNNETIADTSVTVTYNYFL